VRIQAFNSVQF